MGLDEMRTEINENQVAFYFQGGDGNEIMKICFNGDIFVKGKLVENDKEVVDGLREFLISLGYLNKSKA